jgi:tRNA-specific 2-thiouridylase
VPNGDYAAFLNAYLKETGVPAARTRGEIVTADGRRLGEHEGVHRFTVGQRRGLGIAAAEPLYVIATEPATQRVIVGGNDELLRGRFFARDVNWISIAEPREPVRARVKIRNKHAGAAATVKPVAQAHGLPGRVEVVFDEPQRAVTPGQGAVFYDGDLVLGGGWIE